MDNAPAWYPATHAQATLDELADRAAANVAAQVLVDMADREDALGRGVRALLWAWDRGHRAAAQLVRTGRVYVESCPAYLATVDGVSRYAATLAWAAVRDAVGWVEAAVGEVVALGAKLRPLPRGKRRGGRHLLLESWQVVALDMAVGAPRSPLERRQRVRGAVPLPSAWKATSGPQERRTVAVCCPAHEDRTPSLVLWPNGGGLCMSCRWRCAWSEHGGELRLHEAGPTPRHADKARPTLISTTKTHERGQGRRRARAGDPVGGMVSTGSRYSRHLGALLGAHSEDGGSTWRTHRSAGHLLAGDVLDALVVAEQRSRGPAATEHAQDALWHAQDLPGLALLPTPLLSVSCMGRRHWLDSWDSWVQRWMLVDLDDVGLDDVAEQELGHALVALALGDPEVGERVGVVRTGPTGVQVWVQLAQPRHTPATWCRLPEVRRWHRDLGQRLLAEAQRLGARGGHPDPSACAAGRWGRRPGWRLVDGELYRSHLLATAT